MIGAPARDAPGGAADTTREADRPGDAACTDAYLTRYIADRERFFTISRSVSVTEMAATLAHELNQPIGAVANLLEGLQRSLRTDAMPSRQALSALQRAAEQTRFAADIVERIRDFTEARSPDASVCDLRRTVARTVDLMDWVFATEHIAITLPSCKHGPMLVLGDETLLQQVIANLLRNAVDALRSCRSGERRIELTFARRRTTVVLQIADNGTGVDDPDSLFMPFLSRKHTGMGVGLNICRSFVELHRGKLWLSDNVWGGCTARVQLPLLPDGDGDRHEPSATGDGSPDAARPGEHL